MAILKVCAVRDRAVDSFNSPLFVRSLGEATRMFTDAVNQKDTPFNAHPEDYDLYHLGDFDDNEGKFVVNGSPRQVAVGKDVLQPMM